MSSSVCTRYANPSLVGVDCAVGVVLTCASTALSPMASCVTGTQHVYGVQCRMFDARREHRSTSTTV